MNLTQTSRYYTTQQYTCVLPEPLTEEQEYRLDLAIYELLRSSPTFDWHDGILIIEYDNQLRPADNPAELMKQGEQVYNIITAFLEERG